MFINNKMNIVKIQDYLMDKFVISILDIPIKTLYKNVIINYK